MPLTLWLSLAAVCALGAMSPGPSLAMVLRHTLGGGRTPGVIAGLTHAMGVGLYALLTVWGLGAVISRQPMLFMVITWGGAAYLAWLGIKALRAGCGGALEAQGAASGPAQAARDGGFPFYAVLNGTDAFLREAVANDVIPDSIMSGTQVGQVRFMLMGLLLALLAAFRPQGIFGNKEEMALDDR